MSAFGGKADIKRGHAQCPLMTQSGHAADIKFLNCDALFRQCHRLLSGCLFPSRGPLYQRFELLFCLVGPAIEERALFNCKRLVMDILLSKS